MTLDDFNPLKALTDLAGKAIDAKAAKYSAGTFDSPGPAYGVDEYGRTYLRGAPSGPGSIDPRLMLLGAGLLAIGLVVYLAKN